MYLSRHKVLNDMGKHTPGSSRPNSQQYKSYTRLRRAAPPIFKGSAQHGGYDALARKGSPNQTEIRGSTGTEKVALSLGLLCFLTTKSDMTEKSYSIATIEIAGELNVLPPPVECSPDGNSCLFSQSNRPRFREEAENLIIKKHGIRFPVTEPGRSGARRGKRNHYGNARARGGQCAFRSSA